MSNTIAAISTAVGEAGIGIVRISGSDAINIGNSIFRGINTKQLNVGDNRKLIYGHIVEGEEIVDEVLITYMKEPFTYTRENMVEIYCHGGIIPVRKVLELLLRSGARLAEPGEFTKRAFLNGRLDLSQAEAVMDIIESKTDKSYEVSLKQLEGSLSHKVRDIGDLLLAMIAHVEVSIDFPDHEVDEITYEEMIRDAKTVKEEIEKLLATADRGKILRDGLNTIILGKPNVGKSSLLNAILRENRAIVTDIPGTTRDIIEEFINIDGIPLKIVDTAGIRDTEDIVEKLGVDRAKDTVEMADLIIAVFDASRELTKEDYSIIELIKDKKTIALLNKSDLESAYDEEYLKKQLNGKRVISSSITTGVGVDLLENSIKDMFYSGQIEIDSGIIVNNMRHKNQLELAFKSIASALVDIEAGVPLDCIEVDLRNCWEDLGEITGDSVAEDIIDKIFAEFCLGK